MDKLDMHAKIKYLVNELNKHTELYDSGNPIISDKEWDDMYFELVKLEQEWKYILPDSPTQKVNYTVVNELQKVKHNHSMLSLDKTKDWNVFVQYFMGKSVVGMIKLDGLTCSLRYVNGRLISAETRGDGEEGEDILHNALVVKNIPKKIDYTDELIVDGEIVCTKHDFEEFKEQYANPRNFASGSIRLLDSQECAKRNLKFVLWNVVKGPYSSVIDNFVKMQNLGFTVTPWTSSFDWDAKEFLVEQAEEAGYPIDGLVGRFDDIAFGDSLGTTGHHSRAAYAFKFYDELYETKLVNIEWTMGKTGVLTPTAVFEPVEIGGATVEKASVHNLSILTKLDLHVGDVIEVFKANMIIPQIKRNVSADKRMALGKEPDYIIVPSICPICGGYTEIKQDNNSMVLVCVNNNCQGKLLGKLTHFVSKPAMNIGGMSEATLDFLITKGWIRQFDDIYYLKDYKIEWQKCNGFGKKSVENILDAIEQSRNVKLENFITALSIPNIGTSAAKTISEHFNGSYEEFINAYFYWHFDWTTLKDFGQVMADNINTYLHDNLEMINELALEMRFIKHERKEVAENPFNGKTLCVTGKLNHFIRDSINAKITELGAKATGSVSKNTDYLITNEASGSSKYKKAIELNVPIITEDEFLKMIGE